jgi:large subunit ribosomal protein L29
MAIKLKQEREDLRKLDKAALRARLIESKQELFNLRFMLTTGGTNNNAEVNRVKKSIARIHTILREKELSQS